jgi:hypothetical protein
MSAATVNFTVLDAKGKSSVIKIRVPTGFTIANYASFAVAMGQLITPICEGSITEITVSLPISLSGATIRATALSIADVFKKALFTVRSSVAGLFAKFIAPTYNEANTVTGSDQLDVADPDVAAYVAILEGGINVAGTIIDPRDLRGQTLDTVTGQREIFRKFN